MGCYEQAAQVLNDHLKEIFIRLRVKQEEMRTQNSEHGVLHLGTQHQTNLIGDNLATILQS